MNWLARDALDGVTSPLAGIAEEVRAFLDPYAAGGADLPPVPREILRHAGLRAPPVEPLQWLALGQAIADALLEFPEDSLDGDRGPEKFLAYAAGNLRLRDRRLGIEADCALVADRDAVIAQARGRAPTWRWIARDQRRHESRIELGRLRFRVAFGRGPGGVWHQAWGGIDETQVFLDHLGRMRREGTPIRTGLFPALDRAIGEITRDFLESVSPTAVRVDGLDAARNRHNWLTYGRHAPDGYALEPIRSGARDRATAGGIDGVRFVRLPEADMGFDPAPGMALSGP